jgi:hypothetical protein
MRYSMRMRLLAFAYALMLVGCSTDTFNDSDAASDGGIDAATIDASSDGGVPDAPGIDASSDASTDGGISFSCPYSMTTSCNNNCGGTGPDGGFVIGHCCVDTTGVGACSLACVGASFPCLGPADCGGSKAICCLTGTSLNLNLCPRPYADNVSSACTSVAGCTGRRVCVSDGECADAGHCLQADIEGTSSKFAFGVCSI